MINFLKRMLSLTLVFLMSIPITAFAATSVNNFQVENLQLEVATIQDKTGQNMTFKLQQARDSEEEYTILYYYGGQLEKTYHFSNTSPEITVHCEDGRNYTFTREKYTTVSTTVSPTTYAAKKEHLGYFLYGDLKWPGGSSYLLKDPRIDVFCMSEEWRKDTVHIVGKKGQAVSDAVASTVSLLLSIGFGAMGGSVLTSTVLSLLGAKLGEELGKYFSKPVSVPLDATIIDYKMRTEFTSTEGMHTMLYQTYKGKTEILDCGEMSDITDSGVTKNTWYAPKFDVSAWADTIGGTGIEFTGVLKTVRN